MSFEPFQLHPTLNANVDSLGYREPTPIQAQAIPSVAAGRDVMGLAQTGTGKTAAFALPILHRLMQEKRSRLRALVIAPTRELAEQINGDFGDLGRRTGLTGVTLYGGVAIKPQIDKLRAGVDVAIACPGRLLDHINRGTIDLRWIQCLVLDEADQMFDMGFLPVIREIIGHLPSQRQSLLFSATMPKDIRHLASEILNDPVTVEVGRREPVSTVSHALYPIEKHLKTKLLCELLDRTDTESVLVFTRTKHRAKRVGEQLQKAGYKAASLQGNLSQNRRQAAMDGFRSGKHQILVATDIAARGIDVANISHVINYDIPDTVTAYTHRIGRTGRAARSGDALTLVTREDRDTVRAIERVLAATIECRTVPGFDYHMPRPARDTEFARPPLPRRGSRPSGPRTETSRHGKPAPRRASQAAQQGAPSPPASRPTSRPASRPASRPTSRQASRQAPILPEVRPVTLTSHLQRADSQTQGQNRAPANSGVRRRWGRGLFSRSSGR